MSNHANYDGLLRFPPPPSLPQPTATEANLLPVSNGISRKHFAASPQDSSSSYTFAKFSRIVETCSSKATLGCSFSREYVATCLCSSGSKSLSSCEYAPKIWREITNGTSSSDITFVFFYGLDREKKWKLQTRTVINKGFKIRHFWCLHNFCQKVFIELDFNLLITICRNGWQLCTDGTHDAKRGRQQKQMVVTKVAISVK